MAGNVGFTLPEFRIKIPQWRIIKDCIEGESRVKSRGDAYLPRPNAADTSPENRARFTAYLTRAVFYNVTQRTLVGLQGLIFKREPTIEMPNAMDVVKKNASGGGVALTQVAAAAAQAVIAYGRAGVLVDYPRMPDGATIAEVEAGIARPTIAVYEPWDILNWRVTDRGAKEVLSLVVLRERYPVSDDGFEVRFANQYRVLRLNGGQYSCEIWQEPGGDGVISTDIPADHLTFGYSIGTVGNVNSSMATLQSAFTPLDAAGKPFTEIPFSFIGAKNNDSSIDNPPLYDLATLNLGHYRNSADYEEAAFICGQPTPVLAGLTQDWVTQVLKGTVQLGSRAAIPLPAGGEAMLLQAEANIMPKEAMDAKEKQMLAIGAKLVEPDQSTRTATEATMDNVSETSILGAIAVNVSAAFTQALLWAAQYMGVAVNLEKPKTSKNTPPKDATGDTNTIVFEVNTDFDVAMLDPADRAQLMAEYQGGGITWSEYRAQLRQAGIATLDDDAAKQQIDEEQAQQVTALVEKNKAMGLDPSGNVPMTPSPDGKKTAIKKSAV
jgi:hypothetical protein